jgi:hypothetical protein
MQQNIKGLLCSLLYQLVEAEDALIENIASYFTDIARKETHTDWSMLELKHVCTQSLLNFGRPLCIFIDGLDEVDPRDGILGLFEVLDTIKQSPSTKLCLASRPEPPIVKRLGGYHQLQIQDLTLEDLWIYANGRLQFPTLYSGERYEQARHNIKRGLIEKSEGVFLWLCLAVKSLNAGLDNEDHLEDVFQRAESLPPDLARLYMDMWTRFNEDHAVYRQSAALYFKLVMASKRPPEEKWHLPILTTESDITIFEMALATALPEFRPELDIPTAEELTNACIDTIRFVQMRCAGMLEIVVQPRSIRANERGGYAKPELSTVVPFGNGSQTIRFIHRTAFDFLTDTPEGRTILNADVTSEQSVCLKLFRAVCSRRYFFPDSPHPSSLQIFTSKLSNIWHMAGSCPNSALDIQLQETMTFLEHWGASKSLERDWVPRHTLPIIGKDEFLVYAASFRLSRYVTAALVNRETCHQLKSYILHAISTGVTSTLSYSQDDCELVEELLHRGADPNYKNCIARPLHRKYFQIASPFCDFLAGILNINLQSATKLSIQWLCHVMELFLSHGANTTDLVNVNFRVWGSREGDFVSAEYVATSTLAFKRLIDKEEKLAIYYCLLVPAFTLINALVYQFEKALWKSGHSKEECCSRDHVTAIGVNAKLVATPATEAKPRIIALVSHTGNYHAVSDEDSVYLSDAVVEILKNPRSKSATALLKDRSLEVYQRNEHRSDVCDLLLAEGLIWDSKKGERRPVGKCDKGCHP